MSPGIVSSLQGELDGFGGINKLPPQHVQAARNVMHDLCCILCIGSEAGSSRAIFLQAFQAQEKQL